MELIQTKKGISRLRCFGICLLVLLFSTNALLAAKLDPANWRIYASPRLVPPSNLTVTKSLGSNVPPGTLVPTLLTNLVDNDPATLSTLMSGLDLFIDLGQTCTVHRVFLTGGDHELSMWPNWSQTGTNPPLGLLVVSVGNRGPLMKRVAEWTVPYDAGNPVDTEVDMRFSPTTGRFVRIQLQTQVLWGLSHWPGYTLPAQPPAVTNLSWNIGELELYGFTDPPTNENAVVLPGGASNALALAASDLSYYLGELTGKPHPIISPTNTNQFSGTIYRIVDLKSLAPDYNTMMNNIAAGLMPDGVNVETSGREVVFRAWPYRSVLWSAWEFLERQGVRWVYPEGHGDYVPTGQGVSLGMLPLRFTPSAKSIYANWDASSLQPWPPWMLQSVRQGFLYPWRNRWNFSWNGYGPLGGSEIPAMASPGITLNNNYSEGFVGYPHNFNSVVPNRILAQHPDWWGYSTNLGARIAPTNGSAPAFCMDNPFLINFVAAKAVAVQQASPLACTSPLNIAHIQRALNLLPLDATAFCECTNYCLPANGSWVADPVPWVAHYKSSFSGMYYNFVTQVANEVAYAGSDAIIGALAYADVFLPPATKLPANVQVEVCMYGAPNLPIGSSWNSALKQALDTWPLRCSRLATYDYALLHTDYWQTNASLPVPLVTASVDRAQYLASIGALDGGCQATTESLPYNPWNFYAYPRIRWNTNQTGDQLLHEFFPAYFAEAAAPMLAYYKVLQDHVVTNNANMYYRGYCYNVMPGTFPLHVLAAMQTNLQAAELQATNWLTIQRVAKMREGFNWVIGTSGLTGVNLSDVSPYQVIKAANGPVALNLAQMNAPTISGPAGKNWAQLTGTNWTFTAAGEIRMPLNFTQGGTYQVVVTARGVTSDSEWPVMNVYLGASEASSAVNTSGFTDYTFSLTIPAAVWDLTITFKNDAAGGARDLFISGIRIIPE
jgi:hypothetical protein